MATPANRVPVRIARGSKTNLDTAIAAGDLKEGEICYATDENGIYVVEGGVLTQAGADLASTSIDALSDVDTTTAAPTDGQVLTWVNANGRWEPADTAADAVTSVNTQTGAVVLDADDIDDTSTTHKFATAAQLTAADSALQPTDSIDALSDVDTTTAAPIDGQALIWDNANGKWEPGTVSGGGAVDSVNGQTGVVVLDLEDLDNVKDIPAITTYNFVGTPDASFPTDVPGDYGYWYSSNGTTADARFAWVDRNGADFNTAAEAHGLNTFWYRINGGSWGSAGLTTNKVTNSTTREFVSDPGVFPWSYVDGVNDTEIDIAFSDPTATLGPTDGQLLTWVDTNSQWEPADAPSATAVAAPATPTSAGSPGQIGYDSDYIYVAISQDTWKRALLSTWTLPSPLLFHFDEADGSTAFTNSGSLGGSGTSTNSQISTTSPKFGTASFFSDSANSGTGTIPVASVPVLGGGDFTVDFWQRRATGGTQTFLAHIDELYTDYGWTLDVDGTGYRFTYTTNGISVPLGVGFADPGSWAADDINTWHHIALCRDGNTLRLFKNGVESSATGDLTGVTIHTSASDMKLGFNKNFGSNDSFLQGYMDELRITNTAEYTAAFTPPTGPYAA